MIGNELIGATDFNIGIATTCIENTDGNSYKGLREKLEKDVDFIVTEAVYDIEDIKNLMAYIRKFNESVKVIAGIMPLVSIAMGKYMNSNMPGISVPDSILNKMAQAPRGSSINVGLAIAVDIIKQIRDDKICDGVHIMFPSREDRIPEVIEAAGLFIEK
jgi:5,10-methylenetetrahydrofolate reductase